MTSKGLAHFKNKKIVLLQGPVGPFFRRLAQDLRWAGAQVSKINFNGGDWLFFPDDSTSFRGAMAEWPDFFERFVQEKEIDTVLLFGDCRSIHVEARQIAVRLGVEVGVFEEGYVRPDYITFERFGVNAHSQLPKEPLLYMNSPEAPGPAALPVGQCFWHTAAWAMLYYAASHALRFLFRSYKHHRPLNIWEGLYWLRGFWRRRAYQLKERHLEADLSGTLSGKYFLVPLQVPSDFQVLTHSGYPSLESFITEVATSFAKNADRECSLVFKHHPLDRGYNDHGRLIKTLAQALGLEGRLLYIHDQRLPLLLNHSRGVVTINSTVGFSALHHGCPVKTCGIAFYDMLGLTFQGPLDDFWIKGAAQAPNSRLFRQFRSYVIETTQINGNFYRKLKLPGSASGVRWPSTAPNQAGSSEASAQFNTTKKASRSN
jgi:capsular polysaccharide export protein